MSGSRTCEWCKGPLPADCRRDTKTCSKRCRQAKARFKIRRADQVATEGTMRFAYADPPYPKLSRKYYRDHRDFNGEVDHVELVERLVAEYPNGWALSTSADATRAVWDLCPPGTRLAIWVNGPRKVKSYTALHAYESLLVFGGRERRVPVVEDLCDVLSWGGRQHSHPDALPGMKPAAFCEWMFQLLGATHGDQLDDLFPGSGAVTRAWELYTSSPTVVRHDTSARSPRDVSIADPHDLPRLLSIDNWSTEEKLAVMKENGWTEKGRREAPEEGRVIVTLHHAEQKVETHRSLPSPIAGADVSSLEDPDDTSSLAGPSDATAPASLTPR